MNSVSIKSLFLAGLFILCLPIVALTSLTKAKTLKVDTAIGTITQTIPDSVTNKTLEKTIPQELTYSVTPEATIALPKPKPTYVHKSVSIYKKTIGKTVDKTLEGKTTLDLNIKLPKVDLPKVFNQ